MKRVSVFVISFGLLQLACATVSAQQAPVREESPEVSFQIVSATVESFPRALKARNREYREALVLRLSVDRRMLDAQPPSIEAFLYLGNHELRPFDSLRDDSKTEVLLTFHDPEWRKIREPVPMVLTTLHGDPQNNPRKYANYPRFDPKLIGKYGQP